MKFEISILGCGSALPTILRNQSGQIVNVNESEYMIDCGEGTQLMMRKMKKRFQKINQIFISHLHGDHYFGLMGYLSTLHLLGREKEMTVFGPVGLQEIIAVHQKYSKNGFRYPLNIVELNSTESQMIFEDKKVEVHTIPLNHRIYCNGYLIKEKPRDRSILPEKIDQYRIPLKLIKEIKKGADFELENGSIVNNSELTKNPPSPKSYAYCSDTMYKPDIIPIIENVTALYHEATFCEKDKDKAEYTRHSTAKEAAIIARDSKAQKLILGHFSARYTELDHILSEAKTVFENSTLAHDGMEIVL